MLLSSTAIVLSLPLGRSSLPFNRKTKRANSRFTQFATQIWLKIEKLKKARKIEKKIAKIQLLTITNKFLSKFKLVKTTQIRNTKIINN